MRVSSWRGIFAVLVLTVVALAAAGALASRADAAINGASAAPSFTGPGGSVVVTIDADEGGGDVRVSATQGALFTSDQRLAVASCDPPVAMAMPQSGASTSSGAPSTSGTLAPAGCQDVRGEGTLDMVIPDATNNLDTVRVLLVAPDLTGRVTATVVQGASARPVVVEVLPETGSFTQGSIPANGNFALVVFGGGTFDQLIAAAHCPSNSPAFWVTNARGDFVVFIPGATAVAAVNAPFAATFPSRHITPGTPLIGRCLIPVASGVEGSVTLGPTCPVQRVPPDPTCADRPYQATLAVLSTTDGSELARTQSGADGRYRIDLAPGDYILKPLPGGQPFPLAPASQRFTVRSGAYTAVNVAYDTGIR